MISKRKTRSQHQGQKFNVGGAWTEEKEIEIQTKEYVTPDLIPNLPDRELTELKSIYKSNIDQIRSEISEEKYTLSLESEYWDESHNWDLDNDTESEEYWHFVGRYE